MNIYWIIAILPEWIIHSLFFVGVIGLLVAFFVQFIPFINTYKYVIKIISSFLLILGLFLQGALAYKHSTDVAVATLKVKLARAEAKAAQSNTEIVEKIVKDTEVIREKGKTVTEYIDREVVKYDSKCEIPNEVINAHNMAATLVLPEDESK